MQLSLNRFDWLMDFKNEELWVPRDTYYFIQKEIEVKKLESKKNGSVPKRD